MGDRPEGDAVVFPVPGIEGDNVVAGDSVKAANHPERSRSLDMDAVAPLVFKADIFDEEVRGIADLDAERPAFFDGEVPHPDALHVVQEDCPVRAGDGVGGIRATAHVAM